MDGSSSASSESPENPLSDEGDGFEDDEAVSESDCCVFGGSNSPPLTIIPRAYIP